MTGVNIDSETKPVWEWNWRRGVKYGVYVFVLLFVLSFVGNSFTPYTHIDCEGDGVGFGTAAGQNPEMNFQTAERDCRFKEAITATLGPWSGPVAEGPLGWQYLLGLREPVESGDPTTIYNDSALVFVNESNAPTPSNSTDS